MSRLAEVEFLALKLEAAPILRKFEPFQPQKDIYRRLQLNGWFIEGFASADLKEAKLLVRFGPDAVMGGRLTETDSNVVMGTGQPGPSL